MDWQQIVTLAIVGATAALFGRHLFRSKRPLDAKSPCGCASPQTDGEGTPSILFKARKGERARIIVRPR